MKIAVFGLALSAFTAAAQQTLIPIDATWRYNASSNNLGTAWRALNYNDQIAGWNNGQQLFGTDANVLPLPFTTPLPLPHPITVYFRYRFTFNQNPQGISMIASNLIEDGAVFYLNGARVGDIRLANQNPVFGTTATGAPEPQPGWEVFTFNPTNLIQGQNVMAVELHQSGTGSSDSAFAMTLTAIMPTPVVITNQPGDQTLPRGSTLVLSVGASGSNPTYQWRKNGVNLVRSGATGITGPTLTIPNVIANDSGTYSVIVSNALGSVTSSNAVVNVVDDTFGPVIERAVADLPDTNIINVFFDETVSAATARNTNNYRITTLDGSNSIPVILAQSSVRQVRLSLAADLVPGTSYVLTVNNVEDSQGNAIEPNSRIVIAVFAQVFGMGVVWKSRDPFDFTGTCPSDPGPNWKNLGYDDSDPNCWFEGSGIFHYPDGVLASSDLCDGVAGHRMTFVDGQTYYFRRHFIAPTNSGMAVLRINHIIDDGAVFYLNGREVQRVRMPAGTVTHTTRASTAVNTPNCDPTLDIIVTNLFSGTNLFAVSVHQANPDGLDVAFAMGVEAAISGALPEPKVRITSPSSGANFNGPPITITADASDADGSVTNVQFFAGAMSLGNDRTAPYSVTWSNATFGNHTLTAVARDNAGLATTSAPVMITITQTEQPVVNIANVPGTNHVQLSWQGVATLQSATTLLASNTVWNTVTNVSPYIAPTDGPRRFYRLIQ